VATRLPRLGLALGGGGVRGLAHIGVLKVLEREGIPIHFLAGTSMGGLVAAAYASGLSARELEAEALRMSRPRNLLALLDRRLPSRGLLQGEQVEQYLAELLGDVSFDELRIPLALIAADLNTEQKAVLQQGRLVDAVRCTIAFPGLFSPVELCDQLLVDGGLLDNLPAGVVRQMGADVVVAVTVATTQESVALFAEKLYRRRFVPTGLVDIMEVVWRSLGVMMHEIDRYGLQAASADLLLCPAIPSEVTVFTGLNHADRIIASGERAAQEQLPHLLERLDTGR
jgi:NTE family protein